MNVSNGNLFPRQNEFNSITSLKNSSILMKLKYHKTSLQKLKWRFFIARIIDQKMQNTW